MGSRAGSVLRWTGSSFLWLCAPVVGLMTWNLPGFWARLSQEPPSAPSENIGYIILATAPIVAWGMAVFWTSRLHRGWNQRIHLGLSIALFALGLATFEVYKLIVLLAFMIAGT
jgi:hypothetical protein